MNITDISASRKENLELEQAIVEKTISFFNKAWKVLVGVGFAIGLLGLFWFDISSDRGMESFGNFAGGTVVAFWSLAGVILIYLAFLGQKLDLIFQKEELRLNRDELKANREVMNEQKKEFELQNKMLSNQNFQNLFFQMLKNYTDIVINIDIGMGSSEVTGRDCFNQMFNSFRNEYNKQKSSDFSEQDKINSAYLQFYNPFQNDLGNYFRNLYHIFKLIESSEIEDKKSYANIVRAQLSTYEIALLFYNCLSPYGVRKFKPLVEKYNLTKNLPKKLILKPEHIELYSGISFEEDEDR